MKKGRPDRMLKTERVERKKELDPEEDLATKIQKRMDKIEERLAKEARSAGYPCKYCQGKTEVDQTFPPYETTQEPIKIVRRRRRRCLSCGRTFTSQEETIKG